MADFKTKIEKASAGDPIQLTVHCTQGGPIVSKPIAKAFQSPGGLPRAEIELDEQEKGQVYHGTLDDPYDETTFVQVTARLSGGNVVTKEYPLSAVNEECDTTAKSHTQRAESKAKSRVRQGEQMKELGEGEVGAHTARYPKTITAS